MIARYGQLANLFLKVSDLLVMLCALSLAIIINYAPEARVPISEYAIDFLSTRVKVANALLGAAMLLVWYMVFNLQGIFVRIVSAGSGELKENGRQFSWLVDAADGGANRRLANHHALDCRECRNNRVIPHRLMAFLRLICAFATSRTQHQDVTDRWSGRARVGLQTRSRSESTLATHRRYVDDETNFRAWRKKCRVSATSKTCRDHRQRCDR